jgi:hypothetical protein
MTYYRKKKLITIAETWYDTREEPQKKADIVKYKFVDEKREGAVLGEDLFTLINDLTEPEEAIFSRIRKNTRYEINRAKNKDAVECAAFLGPGEKDAEKIGVYIDFFNAFTASKKRSAITFEDIRQFLEAGTFCVRSAADKDQTPVYTMHAYIISDNRARLYQSSSHYRNSESQERRNLIGRANRLLHWEDMLFFKRMGLRYYDFGGWYGGLEDGEKIAINQFKESFGGEKKREYSYMVPRTVLGKSAVFIRGLARRAP